MLDYEKILETTAQQLNDVIVGLKKAAALADAAYKRASDEETALKKAREELATVTEAVEVREKAIEGKELMILSADALTAQKDAVEAQRVFLANEKRKFEKECIEIKNKLNQELSDVAVERQVFKEATEALAVEKGNYKLKILEEFAKGAGK